MSPKEPIRIAVLYARLTGYVIACLDALKNEYDVELLVIAHPSTSESPFDEKQFTLIDHLYNRNDLSTPEITKLVEEFDPLGIFMAGWYDKEYLKVARQFRRKGGPVIAGSDGQWNGTFREQVGRLISPWFLHPAIDVIWGSGDRQREKAAKYGFPGSQYLSGYYACNWSKFAAEYREGPQPHSFIYVGRYAKEKGLDVLLAAYQEYRNSTDSPWNLICVGAGPLQHLLTNKDGIEDRGFVQPDQLPAVMASAGAFLLPSHYEPWGVVVQEAATVGLPLICSDACGAIAHLLQDGYNGYVFERGSVSHLTQCLKRLSSVSTEELTAMGERSHQLSKQFTPKRWAHTLVDALQRLKEKNA